MPEKPPAPPPGRLADLIGSDHALPGTLASRFMRCGKTNCRCKAEPPVLQRLSRSSWNLRWRSPT